MSHIRLVQLVRDRLPDVHAKLITQSKQMPQAIELIAFLTGFPLPDDKTIPLTRICEQLAEHIEKNYDDPLHSSPDA